MDGFLEGCWVDECVDGKMDGWMNGWYMDGR